MIKAKRKKTIPVKVGTIAIGGNNPIAIQSMTNSDTNDVAATVGQVKRLAEAGADLVRITVLQCRKSLKCHRKSNLKIDGYSLPLIADVHFNPKVAEAMASVVEKVRINPEIM
jgi:(E)-4-hydroxy-3-methylbut-2-enyl-diphosphate synthase